VWLYRAVPLLTASLPSGRAITYVDEGEGTPLVQIHGLGTGHRNFDLLRPHLARRLRVLDLDLPGYGGSDPAPGGASVDGFVEGAAGFIETLGLGPAHVHGGSMGGVVAIALAARRPDLVDRLVITCSFGRADRAAHLMWGTWRTAARAGAEALAELTSLQGFSRGFWDRPEAPSVRQAFVDALSSTTPDEFLRDLGSLETADVTAEAAAIRAPTLLLAADEDQMTPVHAGPSGVGMSALATLVPGARLEVLEHCGHFITIERPEDTARHIADWVLG
jgi:pimeloyl-ACP methyl ester carboxylesterase